MGTVILTERFAFSGGRVDRTGRRPVVRDVLLCGAVSANRRRYLARAFAGDRIKKYENRPVFLNHGDGHTPRRYEDRIAKVVNARHRADGLPVGDLEVRPKHPYAETFLDDAEHDPGSVGMSHVAACDMETAADGWADVTAIEEVDSVDVVLDPATTNGLYEHKGGRAVGKISLKTFAERVGPKLGPATWGGLNKVCEDMGALADVPAVDEPAADAEPGDLKGSLMAALTPLLDEAFESGDANKAVAALKDFIKLHAKHAGKAEPKDAAPADKPAEESRARRGDALPAIREAIDALKAAKVVGYDADDIEYVAEAATPADRKVRVEKVTRLMGTAAGGEQPTSAGRHQTDRFREEREAGKKLSEGRDGAAVAEPEFIPY